MGCRENRFKCNFSFDSEIKKKKKINEKNPWTHKFCVLIRTSIYTNKLEENSSFQKASHGYKTAWVRASI